MDITSYILSKKYIEDSLAGAGAIKGKSAFDIACDNGFKGTPTEWLETLKGDTPQIGPSGTWFIGSKDTGIIASPSLAGYATQDYVELLFNSVPKVDLSPYATRKELNEAILGIKIPDVSNFSTREELENAIKSIVFPEVDLSNYTTKDEVTNAINAIPKPDLTPYATKDEVNNAINSIPKVDLSDYAKKTDLPSLEGLASEDYVKEKIQQIEFPTTDLTDYATKDFVQSKINEAQLNKEEVDLSNYYTKEEVDNKFDNIDIPDVDLSGMATEEYVDNAINNINIPSTEGFITKEYVDQAINNIKIPSIEGLATEGYVNQAISNIEIPEVDLEPYVTKNQLEAYATEEFVNLLINEIIGMAPSELDSLEELSKAIKENKSLMDALNSLVKDKADKSDLLNYITERSVQQMIDEAIAAIQIPETNSNINVYEIVSDSVILDELVAILPQDVEIHSGDVMLVSNSLGVKSAYQFDEQWIACDGNVDASKVIMPFDITLAGSYTQVGNLSKTSTGTATFAVKGKSVAQALQEMLSKREQPKIKSNPSVSLTASSGAKEVGTKITPEWSASLNAGSYTYGPATGITASSWEISDTDGNKASTASGEFAEITVGDSTNYRITAKANYAAGAIAVDNLGDLSNPTVQIAAGSKSANGGYITGYRAWFMYVGESLDTIDSTFIRGTSNMGSAPTTQSGVNIPVGTKRVMIAIPVTSSLKLKQVIDVDGMGLDVFGNFTPTTVEVEGLNGYAAKAYNIWVAENANGMAATHYNLIIG